MKKIWKRVCTGILALTTIFNCITDYIGSGSGNTVLDRNRRERSAMWSDVMNDGTHTVDMFHEGHMRVEGETAYCVDINTGFSKWL